MIFPWRANDYRVWLASLIALAPAMASDQPGEGSTRPQTSTFSTIALTDTDDQPVAIPARDSSYTVVAFVSIGCPLVPIYAPRLEAVQREYSPKGVAVIGVAANPYEDRASLAAFRKKAALSISIALDPEGSVAERLGATRTPEVFLLDGDGVVLYSGRIDDQFGFEDGRKFTRPSPTRNDLGAAIEDVLAGRPVQISRTEPEGCRIVSKRKVDPNAGVTWSNQISRLFQRSCQSCHRAGQIGPFPLTTYEETRGWVDMILEVVQERRMPPWGISGHQGEFRNDPSLTKEEIELVQTWVEAGSPEGDPSESPPPVHFPMQWREFVPDRIVFMSKEPFQVPADGVVPYQYFVVDPGFSEDVWADGFECLPGNPAVVHHVSIYAVPPGSSVDPAEDPFLLRHLLFGYNPGSGPLLLPKGTARRIAAGSRLVFQLHYQPSGRPELDNSCLGLRLREPEDVEYPIDTRLMLHTDLDIPAGAAHWPVTATYRISEPVRLLLLIPHLHLRGKSFRIDATYPDGRMETLLDVPRYDFNWQHTYVFRDAKELPSGTVLTSTAVFDNSSANPSNPDPSVRVGWGDQVWDEMMVASFCVTSMSPGRDWVPRDPFAQMAFPWRSWIWTIGAIVAGGVLLILAFWWSVARRRTRNRRSMVQESA